MSFSNTAKKFGFVLAGLTAISLVSQTDSTLAVEIGPGYDFTSGSAPYEHYYVGVDSRPTILTGTYAGLANPNLNRLTFLYSHVETNPADNHFHGIGAYSYTGSASAPVTVATNTNNQIPETGSGEPPLTLVPGTGVFSGRQISRPSGSEYGNLLITPLAALSSFNSTNDPGNGAQLLFNSSANRWSGSLGSAVVALELLNLTPGLAITNPAGQQVLDSIGDTYTLGQGDNFAFRPVFSVADTAPLGTYSATFRLRDLQANGAFAQSGTFSINVQNAQAVPEPSAILGLVVVGGAVVVLRRRAQTSHSTARNRNYHRIPNA
jgi:hypothetical protein